MMYCIFHSTFVLLYCPTAIGCLKVHTLMLTLGLSRSMAVFTSIPLSNG